MIATYDWFGYDIPIGDRYRLIHEAGFDAVLMWWSSSFGRGDYGDYHHGPQMAREAGLLIENIHAPIDRQDDLGRADLAGEASFEEYLQCIDDCAAYGIPTMVVHLPGDNAPLDKLGLERVLRLAERAERAGVNMAMENLRNLENLALVMERVDSPRVGFCYDACHHYNYCAEEDLLGRYGQRLMAIHLHDNDGDRGQHQLPMDGRIDWAVVMRYIAEVGYQGATALEAMNWDYLHWPPERFLREAAARARRLHAFRGHATE